jgi:hypothetical protein
MHTPFTRRRAIGVSAAALASLAGVATATARDATPVASPAAGATLDAIAGGGVLNQLGVEVPFSMMFFTTGGDEGVGGTFRLVDGTIESAPLVIEGTGVISYEQLSETATHGRRIVGWATINGTGQYPFMLQVEDSGEPGSGEDVFNLVLGEAAVPFLGGEDKSGCDCGGFGYSLRSNVMAGDITLLAP